MDQSKPHPSTQFNSQFQQVGQSKLTGLTQKYQPIEHYQKSQPTEQPLQTKFSQQYGAIKFDKQPQPIGFT